MLDEKTTKRKYLVVPLERPDELKNKFSLVKEMTAKIDTAYGRWMCSQRLAIVEPVFANIRAQKRLDRFNLRSKEKVKVQWMLFSLVHNIEKIVNYGMAY